MLSDVVVLATFLGLCLVPGLPLALLLVRRTPAGAAVVVTIGAGTGLAVWLLVGLPAVHLGAFDRPTLAAAGAVLSVVAWLGARRHVHRLRPQRPGWLAAWLGLLAVVALWLRSEPIYFAYQVADFGEYVNRGNILAAGGPFGTWFVNGFPLLLAESSLLLGEANTTAVMPFVGLLMAASILAVLRLARTGRLAVAALAVPLAFHVHSVWFSIFPASETLYAALLVLAILLGVLGLRGGDPVPAAASGAVGFLMVVTRGNGLAFLPLVVLGLVAVPLLASTDRHRVLRWHLASLGAGLWVGSLYDARHNGRYFLEEQSGQRLPEPIAGWFLRVGEVHVGAGATLVVGVLLLASCVAGIGLGRFAATEARVLVLRRAVLVVAVVAVSVVHLGALASASYLPRYEALGVLVWACLAASVVAWGWRSPRSGHGVTAYAIGFPLLTALAMATFQATRMRKSLTVDAPWFLYWDRYFFSETFPMLMVSGGVAAGVAIAAVGRSERRWAVPVAGGLASLLAVLGAIDLAGPTAKALERPMFADAYDELAALDRSMSRDLPVIYDGLGEVRPDGWFWSNSGRVVADPLAQTFGRRLLNRAPPVGADPAPDSAAIVALLADAGADEAYLLQASASPWWPDRSAANLQAESVDEVTIRFERLEGLSRVAPEQQRWIISDLHLRVVLVRAVTGLPNVEG